MNPEEHKLYVGSANAPAFFWSKAQEFITES